MYICLRDLSVSIHRATYLLSGLEVRSQ